MHLHNLSDKSAYRTVVKPQRTQCKMQIRKRHIRRKIANHIFIRATLIAIYL